MISQRSQHEAFYPEWERGILELRIDGGAVVYMRFAWDQTAPYWLIEQEYLDWLFDNHRDVSTAITFLIDPAAAADLQKEYVEIWRNR